MKSEGIILEDERTYQIASKSENEAGEKILGLFDDDSYRDKYKLSIKSSSTKLTSQYLISSSISLSILLLNFVVQI